MRLLREVLPGENRTSWPTDFLLFAQAQSVNSPGGFWTRLDDDLKRSARIDRQKYFPDSQGNWFCDYHVQVGDASIACVLVRVNFDVGARAMRHAFHLSLEFIRNVWVDPTDNRNGYFRIESQRGRAATK